jgi:hypothetical protein
MFREIFPRDINHFPKNNIRENNLIEIPFELVAKTHIMLSND